MQRLIAAVCSIAVITCSSAAFAQTNKGDDVQVMDFKELDKLIAQNKGANGYTVVAGHGPIRVLLVRPRTTFVPEMYKSIENL